MKKLEPIELELKEAEERLEKDRSGKINFSFNRRVYYVLCFLRLVQRIIS